MFCVFFQLTMQNSLLDITPKQNKVYKGRCIMIKSDVSQKYNRDLTFFKNQLIFSTNSNRVKPQCFCSSQYTEKLFHKIPNGGVDVTRHRG